MSALVTCPDCKRAVPRNIPPGLHSPHWVPGPDGWPVVVDCVGRLIDPWPPKPGAAAPLTVEGAIRVVGNGVPLPMGRAVARAVREALGLEVAA